MVAMNETTLQDVERFKAQIGWSWPMVAERLGWGTLHIAKFRTLKLGLSDSQYTYLATVAAAVSAVPLPVEEKTAPKPSFEFTGLYPEAPPPGFGPGVNLGQGIAPSIVHDMGNQVRVMLLDDIAAKLAAEYHDIASVEGISSEELGGARYAIGRMAEKLGVGAEVKALLREPRTPPSALPPMFEVKGPEPTPINPHQRFGDVIATQRAPFENETGTF